jgi:hypothetical protein
MFKVVYHLYMDICYACQDACLLEKITEKKGSEINPQGIMG